MHHFNFFLWMKKGKDEILCRWQILIVWIGMSLFQRNKGSGLVKNKHNLLYDQILCQFEFDPPLDELFDEKCD